MKLRITKEQRLRTKRVMDRVKKMCKYALLVLTVSYVSDSAVYQVVKEKVMGELNDVEDIEGFQAETAFIDMYGDFEEMVQARRDHIQTNSATILQVARA